MSAITWKTTIPHDSHWAGTYRRHKVLKKHFALWRRMKEQIEIEPLKTGMAVLSLFKWISVTLRQDETRDIYVFPFHAIQDYNMEHVGHEINSNYFITRIRRYAAEQLCLPSKRIPLFVHAIAVLDACSLVQTFDLWKRIFRKNKQLDDYFIVNYCKRMLRVWHRRTLHGQFVARIAQRVRIKSEVLFTKRFFASWYRNYHNQRMIKRHWVPRRRSLDFKSFAQSVHRMKMERCQVHLATCHHVTARLAQHFQALRVRRCLLHRAVELSRSAACRDLLVQLLKQQSGQQDQLLRSIAVQSIEHHSFRRHLLDSWHPPSTQSGIRQVVNVLRSNLSSLQSQKALKILGTSYFFMRKKLVGLRTWMAHHLHRCIDVAQLGLTRGPTRLATQRDGLPRPSTAPYNAYQRQRHVLRNQFIASKRIAHAVRVWRWQADYGSWVRGAWGSVRQLAARSVQQDAFSRWLILAAKHRVYQQVAHRVFTKYIHRLTLVALYQWRHQFERRVLIKSNQRLLLQQRDREIKTFTELMHSKHAHHRKYAAMRSWFLFVKDRNKAKRLVVLWLRHARRQGLLQAWACWKTVTSLSTIATCIKALWWGYRVRFLSNAPVYRYLRWYKTQCGKVLRFRRRWQKRKVVHTLLLHHDQMRLQYYRAWVTKRLQAGFRKLFLFFRRRRLAHQALVCAKRYHVSFRLPRLLFQRWRQRAGRQRTAMHKLLRGTRAKLVAAMVQLRADRARQQRGRWAQYLLKKRLFGQFQLCIVARREARCLGLVRRMYVRRHLLQPWVQGLFQMAQARRKALRMRKRRLRQRLQTVFSNWHHRILQADRDMRLARMFSHKMSKFRFLQRWADYAGTDVYNKVVQRVRRHHRDRYYGFHPPSHATHVIHQGPQRLRLNLYKLPYLILGRVSQYLRTAFRCFYQKVLDRHIRLRSSHHANIRMGHFHLRRGLRALTRLHQRAAARPGYAKQRLLSKSRLQHRFYQTVGESKLRRLRQLWYADPRHNSHLFRSLDRWQHLLADRRKRRSSTVQLLQLHQKDSLARLFWKALIQLRRHRNHKRILHNIGKHYFTQNVRAFFAAMVVRRKNRRRRYKLLISNHVAKTKALCRAHFTQLRSLAAAHKSSRRFRFIARLRRQARIFLQLLQRKAFKRHRDRVTRAINKKFRQHVLRSLCTLQRRCAQAKKQHAVLKLVKRSYWLTKKKDALLHWRLISLYKKRINKINRRFLLVPFFKTWISQYRDSNQYNKVIQHMSRKVNTRIRHTYWIYWKIYTTRRARLALQTQLLAAQARRARKKRTLTAWLNAIDNRVVYDKYLLVQQQRDRNSKRLVMKVWYQLTLKFELINFRNMKAVVVNWRYHLVNYRRQVQKTKLANVYYFNRLMYKSLHRLLYRLRQQRRLRVDEELSRRRHQRQKYLKAFRAWKRHMYIVYHHRGRSRRGPAPQLPTASPSRVEALLAADRSRVKSGMLFRTTAPPSDEDDFSRSSLRGSRPASASMFASTRPMGGRAQGLSLSHLSRSPSPTRPPRPPLATRALDPVRESARRGHESSARVLSPSRRLFSPLQSSRFQSSSSMAVTGSHYHHVLQQRYARLTRRQRLLNYDCDDSLWQPFRMFTHWRRVSASRRRLRADLTVKRLFSVWKYYIHVYRFKKLAFLSRLQSLHRRTRLLSVWTPLLRNHQLHVNARYLAYRRQKHLVTNALGFWLRCWDNREAVRAKVRAVVRAVYLAQRRRVLLTWRVKAAHAQSLDRACLTRLTFTWWRKLLLSELYRRLVVQNQVLTAWHQHVEINKAVRAALLLRRQKLGAVLHRRHCHDRLLTRLAFSAWKHKPLHDKTLRQYLQLLGRAGPAVVPGGGYEGFGEVYEAIAQVDGELGANYADVQLRDELCKSQVGRYLLFPEEGLSEVRGGVDGVKLPRHLAIAASLLQSCKAVEKEPRRPIRKSKEVSVIKTLREAMYEVVKVRNDASLRLYGGELSALASPKKFIGVATGVKEEKQTATESTTEYVYTPVKHSAVAHSAAVSTAKRGGELRLNDIM